MTTVQQALTQLQTDLAAIPTRRSGDASLLTVHADLTALAAAIAALPITTGPAVTPPIAPAFLKPGGASWKDAKGLVWSIDASANILQNGSGILAHGWQTHLGMGINGAFYILGNDMNVYGWNGDWQIVPYVSSTTPITAPPPPPPPLSAFFVSPTGSDSNSGSRASPFLTLEKAQTAMRGQPSSGIKTTVLLAGTYNRTTTLNFGTADNNTTWRYDPLGSVNTAILDGGSSSPATGVDLFATPGFSGNAGNPGNPSGITIDGIKCQNFNVAAVNCNMNSSTIQNCDIGFNHNPAGFSNFPPLVSLNGTNNLIQNNYFHDSLSQGTAIFAFNVGENIAGTVVQNNVYLRCVTNNTDGGAIYFEMINTELAGGSFTVRNNFVRDYGAAGLAARAIYLDAGTSNGTVTGNIFGPPINPTGATSSNVIINGGMSNDFENNIIDIGLTSSNPVLVIGPPGSGGSNPFVGGVANKFQRNIIVAKYAGACTVASFDESGHNYDNNPALTSANLTLTNNIYHNYGGGAEDSQGNVISDANPIHTDPFVSGNLYAVASNSPAFNAPVNWANITGGFGPPGFVIPDNGNRSDP